MSEITFEQFCKQEHFSASSREAIVGWRYWEAATSAERERCAGIVERMVDDDILFRKSGHFRTTLAKWVASAIRNGDSVPSVSNVSNASS